MIARMGLLLAAMPLLLAAAAVTHAAESARLPNFAAIEVLPRSLSWQFTLRGDFGETRAAAVDLSDADSFTPRDTAFGLPMVRYGAADGQPPRAPQADPGEPPIHLSTNLPLFRGNWLLGGIAIGQELRSLELRDVSVTANVALRL